MYGQGGPFKPFWSSGWNVFDTIIVSVGVVLMTGTPYSPFATPDPASHMADDIQMTPGAWQMVVTTMRIATSEERLLCIYMYMHVAGHTAEHVGAEHVDAEHGGRRITDRWLRHP